MGLLASPRRRRRLAWASAVVGVVALVLVVNALLPSHGGPAKGVRVAPRAPVFGGQTTGPAVFGGESDAQARARKRAEAVVRPLANEFISDLQERRRLASAYALLAPSLRSRYDLIDWRAGRNLPLAANTLTTPGSTIAFSGGTTVGLVTSIAGANESTLVALRFDKTNGRWLIDYLHRGHTSARIDETNYAPPGFLPGSHVETIWTWLILVGGFIGLILVAAFVSRSLKGPALG
ncbi:MAG: hypothetical protein WAU41_02875 [Gaiellaceae bacterium]